MNCIIFRCKKKSEMYLYLPCSEDNGVDKIQEALPQELLRLTGQLEKVMELELTPDRKLARANVIEVISALEQKGFYLQMPPSDIMAGDESVLNNPSDTF